MALWVPSDGLASVTGREWYDGGDPTYHTITGGNYSAAVNRYGVSAQDATQGTAGARPAQVAAQVNGLPIARTALGDGKSLQRTPYSPIDLRFIEFDFDDGIGFYDSGFAGFTDAMPDAGNYHMWMAVYGTGGCSLYRDDNLQWSNAKTFANAGVAWWIGKRTNSDGWGQVFFDTALSNELPSDTLEIGRATGVITTADRNKLFGYGCWRAGLQANLPGGHPYISAAPTTGAASAGAVLRQPSRLILPNILR